HDNNIIVLAEGVETKEELKMVIQLGVDLIQGYYTARPSEEIVVSISKSVKNEILEYNRIGSDYKGRQVYVSGKESHISLPRLVAEKYSIIEISDEGTKEVTISGMADMETDIYLRVKSGYQGKIILDNVALQGKRHGASIDIGNDCDVTLILRGENQCLNGGIRIPEDSRLTLEGEGHLYIMVDGANYFGIGNDFNARHGELVFEQSGCIEIKGNGMKGIGIGSGFGGPIRIHRGKYVIRMIGQDGVGIGSYSGDVDPLMKDCDVRIDMATARAVGVGSIMGSANIHLEYLAWNGELNAEEAIGLGTFAGKKSEVGISHANVMINLFAARACGIGANNGMVSMYVDRSSVTVAGDGTEAVAWGNQSRSAKIRVNAGKMESRLHTALAVNVGVTDENVTLDKSEYHYMKNGETVILKAE
ncbi:MAG: EAL domain-containing protein, partial [Eubacterium sp.]|nr:EAL domain-containing protein [Eubacterium sp.]